MKSLVGTIAACAFIVSHVLWAQDSKPAAAQGGAGIKAFVISIPKLIGATCAPLGTPLAPSVREALLVWKAKLQSEQAGEPKDSAADYKTALDLCGLLTNAAAEREKLAIQFNAPPSVVSAQRRRRNPLDNKAQPETDNEYENRLAMERKAAAESNKWVKQSIAARWQTRANQIRTSADAAYLQLQKHPPGGVPADRQVIVEPALGGTKWQWWKDQTNDFYADGSGTFHHPKEKDQHFTWSASPEGKIQYQFRGRTYLLEVSGLRMTIKADDGKTWTARRLRPQSE